MDKIRLKWKIFSYLLVFCGVLLFILWLFQTIFLGDMYKMIRRHEMKNAIALIEQNLGNPNLIDIVKDLETEKSIMVSPTREFVMPNTPLPKDRNIVRPESITEVKEFTLSNGQKISLTFHAMITPVNATVSTLQIQLYIITGIMIIISIIIALILSNRVSKPLAKLNEGAKKLSFGNYKADFDGQGFLEVKELSDTLNNTAVELSKVENLRRELIANISHDLRTPLSLIYSYAEMMNDFPQEISPSQVQIIMAETKRLSSLVNDILDVSKFESGIIELKTQSYNLTDIIQTTVENISALVKNNGYTITFEQNEEIYVTADEVKITQAFYNLLTNAINYSGPKKSVLVKQIKTETGVKIEVIDYGEGISEENMPYIWDRYYKIDKKHKRAVTGTGIGLSIVKKIFDLHGIKYGVVSKLEEGSNFWFELELK